MHRLLFVAAAAAPLIAAGCSPSFKDKRTPSGEFCSDMVVYPAGHEVEREYHRLQPITSDPKARTEAERLESLRKAACLVGGDAVIEAVNEEARGENAAYITVSSGTAVIWLRPNGEVKPLSIGAKKPASSAEPEAPPPPEVPSAEPSATPSSTPATSKSGKPNVPPAKSAQPAVKPASSVNTPKKPLK
jgi:hypothetical protein